MDFISNIKLPDTKVVSGFAYNALQTVGDNITDLGSKIQNSQIADKIKQTINGEPLSSEERKRSDRNERKRLTDHVDESDEDEVRIEISREWYTDNGGKIEEPSVFSKFTSLFNSDPTPAPNAPTKTSRRENNAPTAPPPPPAEPATWQDTVGETWGSWKNALETKITSLRQEEPEPERM